MTEHPEESLLPLRREYTDKEQIALYKQQNRELKTKVDHLKREVTNLTAKNEKLKKRIQEDDLQFPSTLNGKTQISVRAYFKLRRQHKELEERFWEVVQELNKLKGDKDLVKL